MDQTRSSHHDPYHDPYHEPVLRAEVVDLFAPVADGTIVDGTFGGGGHAMAILEAHPTAWVLGIDRDPDAVANAPSHPRLRVVRGNFADMASIVESVRSQEHEPPLPSVRGVLLDLGISSHQVDTARRGFSYHRTGPLDMRMGPDAEQDAARILAEADVDELTRIFRTYGEERFARRIAQAIVRARPLRDTTHLASVVAEAVPAPARRAAHPARRVFQAIRIAVNAELDALERGLDAGIDLLPEGGRIVVISYHSLEDRIVKTRFVAGARTCTCPPDLPVCACGATPELKILTKRAVRPSEAEIAANPRARSARLRAAEKLHAGATDPKETP